MTENRTKQSIKNVIASFTYQAVMLVLSFISRTVFIYILGVEYLGLNGIFSDVLSLLSLADLGFGTAMAYTFYKPLAEDDHKTIASLIGFYSRIYNYIAAGVLVVGLACIPFLDYIVNTEKEIPNLIVLYLISLSNVVISYLFVYKTTLLSAAQKNYKIIKVNTWMAVVKTVLQVGILFLLRNYIAYLLLGVVLQLITNIIATRETEKEFQYIKDKKIRETVSNETKESIFSNLRSVFVYKISTTLFTATDNILISMIVGTAIVGVYSNYLMVSNKLLLLEQLIFGALTASIGNIIAKDTNEKKYEIFQATQSVSFIFSGIIVSVFCLMANDFVHVWLGSDYELSLPTVIAISLNTYLACVLQPLWVYRDAAGLYLKTKYIMLCGAIINIVLSIALGRLWGIFGIIIASAIARLSSYFWYEPKILFAEYFDRKPGKYYLSLLINMCLVVMSVAFLHLITKKIVVENWGQLIIKGLVIGITCSMVFLIAYRNTEGFNTIKVKTQNIIKSKKGC